ncbi:nucleotidyltransferase family protein [Burkholderia sp. L27(2015)]|jgi:predicted nucleotidyltransferase|uniref:nucleotidyltransferase family protein n=1 Tax=Burkholderia sp. L27(2015) TaxID=1641858 RepID=UPI00131DD8A9|nr:nucleotidyltransferase family protein [Burkholderia sp. L27(2015)]
MRPSIALNEHRAEIRRIVEANKAVNPRIFGSVARGEDEDGSDLDILVDTTPTTSLLDIGIIQDALVRLLGVDVDVLTPKGLPATFRAAVIAEALPV